VLADAAAARIFEWDEKDYLHREMPKLRERLRDQLEAR
jgi:hypothetical protein